MKALTSVWIETVRIMFVYVEFVETDVTVWTYFVVVRYSVANGCPLSKSPFRFQHNVVRVCHVWESMCGLFLHWEKQLYESQNRETVEYGRESRESRNQECLSWRRPTAIYPTGRPIFTLGLREWIRLLVTGEREREWVYVCVEERAS
jgi:hypothetical protein